MAIQDLIQRVTGSSDALTRLSQVVDSKRSELAKIDAELVALDKAKKRLWIAQDVDGQDVSKDLSANEKKRQDALARRERVEAVLDEVSDRRHAIQEELARQEFEAAVTEMLELNEDTLQLDAEYRKAASEFFAAAARSSSHNARQRELYDIQQRYADNHAVVVDGDVVWPRFAEQVQSLEWKEAQSYTHTDGAPLLVNLKLVYDTPVRGKFATGASHADLLERAGEHFAT